MPRGVFSCPNRGRRTPPEREGRHGIAFCTGRESKTDRCRIACIVTRRCRRVFRITLLGEDFPNSYPGAWDFPVLLTTATAITRGSRLPQGRVPAARSATSGAACGNTPPMPDRLRKRRVPDLPADRCRPRNNSHGRKGSRSCRSRNRAASTCAGPPTTAPKWYSRLYERRARRAK